MENNAYKSRKDLQEQSYEANAPVVAMQAKDDAFERMQSERSQQRYNNIRSKQIIMRNIGCHLRC